MKAKRKLPSGKLVVGPSRRDQAVLDAGGVRTDSVLYDFSSDGGAIGNVDFGRILPAGAIITAVYSDEITALTSGGAATVQLQAGAIDLTDAIAFDTGFAGSESQALASSATAIKISADSELKIDIATAALTAGKLRFYVEYRLPND